MEADKKIQIQDLSVDELMEVARKPLSKPIKKRKNKDKSVVERSEIIKDFILSEKIKSHATIKVASVFVYDRYYKWANLVNDHKILNIVTFNREFSKLFKMLTSGRNKYYLLHPEGFNLSDENYATIKEKYTNFKKKT